MLNTTLTETLIPDSKKEEDVKLDDIPECVYEDVKFSGNNEIVINGTDNIDWEPFVCTRLLTKKSKITIKDINRNFLHMFSIIFSSHNKINDGEYESSDEMDVHEYRKNTYHYFYFAKINKICS